MPRGLPYIYDVFREDVEVSAEKLVDRVDPPCYFPLIGLAQLHHCHWKCTVTFTEHIDVAFPCPFEIKRRRSEVVYIDKDHLRLCMASNSDDGRNANSGSCPGGRFAGKIIPKEAAKCPSAKQVPLDLSVPPIIPSGLQSGTPAREQRDAPMTVGDVVRMSQKGISQEIILRQMELTNAIFNLTVDDIIELHDQGVTEKIIRAMQERREPSIPKLQTEPGAASRPRDPGLIHPLPPVPLFLEPGMSLSIRRLF
jgi:hypothetical protein